MKGEKRAMNVSEIKVHQRSGLGFTAIGYGGAPIGNFNGSFTDAEAQEMVSQAWTRVCATSIPLPGYGTA